MFAPPPDSPGDGGAERTRTVDPLLAKQVLSHLSYSPAQSRLSLRAARARRFQPARPNRRLNPVPGSADAEGMRRRRAPLVGR